MPRDMTNKEAKEILYSIRSYYASMTVGFPKGKDVLGIDDIMCSEIANACLMGIVALEKDIGKRPIQPHTRSGMGYDYHDYYCPVCNTFLVHEPEGEKWKQEIGWSRCGKCGQKILWGDPDDE